jgi:hypothetical protein
MDQRASSPPPLSGRKAVTELTQWRIAKALDEIARTAAHLHSRADSAGVTGSGKEMTGAHISLRTLDTILELFKEQVKNGPKPWDEEIPDLPANLRGHWSG